MELSNKFAILSLLEDEQPLPDPDSVSEFRHNDKDIPPRDKPNCSSLRLCDICIQIFSDQPLCNRRYNHRSSHKSLITAAQQSCYICSLLLEKVAVHSIQISPPTKVGLARRHGLSYKISFALDGGYSIFFQHEDGENPPKEVLRLTVYEPWVHGRLTTRPVGESTWSNENIRSICQWLQDCVANEESQTSSPTPNLPTRLLHIELNNGGEYKLNLREGATLPQSTLYLTLSHCWGDKPISGLLTRNLERFKQDIEFESLPKTFQHAIIVTRDLGYSYLWIDSLCIIQNCKEDWLKEGPQMGEIYQNAVCNIAASGFKDSHAGLFVSRNVDTLLPLKIDVRWPDLLGSSECHIMEEESWDSVENAHLNSRGWVFQERILSTRIIHFGIRQLFWQSCTTSGNEQWPNGLPFEADGVIMGDLLKENWESLKDPIGRSVHNWIYIVEEYSQRNLSYATDKLAAMSGIATEIQKVTSDEYLAGLWKMNLLSLLLWNVNYPESSIRIQPFTAPTWSWASISGSISYTLNLDSCKHDIQSSYLSKVQEAKTSPMKGHSTGPVEAGFLRLEGPLRQARIIEGNAKYKGCPTWSVGGRKRKIYFLPDIMLAGEPEYLVGNEQIQKSMEKIFFFGTIHKLFWGTTKVRRNIPVHSPSKSIFLLPILSASYHGIFQTDVLALTPTDLIRGQFQRIGLFFTVNHTRKESILCLSSNINPLFYEEIAGGDKYTISII